MDIMSPTMLLAVGEFIKAINNAVAFERPITPQDAREVMESAAALLTEEDRRQCGGDDPFSLAVALQQRLVIAASRTDGNLSVTENIT